MRLAHNPVYPSSRKFEFLVTHVNLRLSFVLFIYFFFYFNPFCFVRAPAASSPGAKRRKAKRFGIASRPLGLFHLAGFCVPCFAALILVCTPLWRYAGLGRAFASPTLRVEDPAAYARCINQLYKFVGKLSFLSFRSPRKNAAATVPLIRATPVFARYGGNAVGISNRAVVPFFYVYRLDD